VNFRNGLVAAHHSFLAGKSLNIPRSSYFRSYKRSGGDTNEITPEFPSDIHASPVTTTPITDGMSTDTRKKMKRENLAEF